MSLKRKYKPILSIDSLVFGEKLGSLYGQGPYPLAGQWELTCRCNLKCVMCYTDCFNTPEKIREELSLVEIMRIMDEIADAGCLELTLTGGEPLMRKDFPEIYRYAKSKGFLVSVFTNGTLIQEEIANLWQELPPQFIEISYHGLGEKSFEGITQRKGSHEKCLRGIKLLLERDLNLVIKAVGMTVNSHEILGIKSFVESLKGAQFKFGSEIIQQNDGSQEVFRYQLPKETVRSIETSDEEFYRERCRQDDLEKGLVEKGESLCGGGTFKFHIDAYGKMQLCCNNREMSYDLRRGNFQEGFFKKLPGFACPWRNAASSDIVKESCGC